MNQYVYLLGLLWRITDGLGLSQDESLHLLDAQDYLVDNIKLAVRFLKFQEFVGREKPDVMT